MFQRTIPNSQIQTTGPWMCGTNHCCFRGESKVLLWEFIIWYSEENFRDIVWVLYIIEDEIIFLHCCICSSHGIWGTLDGGWYEITSADRNFPAKHYQTGYWNIRPFHPTCSKATVGPKIVLAYAYNMYAHKCYIGSTWIWDAQATGIQAIAGPM